MGDVADRPDKIRIPESLLTVQSTEDAVTICSVCGLRPILLHAPTPEGGCTCGRVHDKTLSGSSSTGKHPIQSNWQKRELSLDELKDQLARTKFTPNVGMVLGKQPGGEYIIAIDVDDADRFAELEAELGPLPETPRCDSGRGYRLFYTLPPEIDVGRLKNVTGIGSEPGSPKPGVDVKAEGGQVVIAPSLHANGKRYVWTVVGYIETLPSQWALQLLKKPETPKSIEKYTPTEMNKPGRARNNGEKYLTAAVNGEAYSLAACGQGLRNNTLYASACRMFEFCGGMHLSHKWQWVHDELLSAAKASGLPDHESRATLASAERRVRESGKVRSPMVLADPAPSRPSQEPPPDAGDAWEPDTLPSESDPWMLAPESQGTKRPVIQLSTELLLNANDAISAMSRDEDLYQRDGMLVTVTRVTREEVEASPHVEIDETAIHRQMVEGTPQIRILTRAVIKSSLSKVAIFQKWVQSSGGYKAVLPPEDIVGHIHDVGAWPGIRLLSSITETPTFGPGGIIMQHPGYDPVTGYLYIPSCKFPEVKDEAATQENARWAFQFLSEVFHDFPYVNDAHRSVPIAAILTLIARPAIAGSIPAVLFDASTRGSGKTLQTDAIATIATGRGAPRMNYTSDDVELEKILGGYALKGSAFICLDNVPTMRPFGGGPLDRCITARDKVDLRILGRSEVPTLSWRALIMATGNNMSLYGDTARRVLMARLEPTEESPEQRTRFKHQDLLEFIGAQRPRLVAAALLMLRSYWRAGRPDMGCKRWGSFDEWARLIPHAIVFSGGADPMLARPERDEEVDVEAQALSCLLDQLPVLHARVRLEAPNDVGDAGIAARTIVAALYERVPEWSEFESLRNAVETLCKPRSGRSYGAPDAVTLGYKLRAMRSRVVGGRKLVGRPGDAHVMLWKVEQVSS